MKINERMDAGNILFKKECPIDESDNFESLYLKLAQLGAQSTADFINTELFSKDAYNETKQLESDATYCHLLKASDYELNLNDSPEKLMNQIKAFSPKPGAYIVFNNKRIKILSAKIENNALLPIDVQAEGKKRMTYKEFCCGYPSIKELFKC